MRIIIPEVDSYELSSGYLYAIWLRIQLEGRVLFRRCHLYIAGSDSTLDLFRLNSNKLEKFAYFNGVTSIEEVDGPPEPAVEPAAPEAVEVAAAPAKAVSDDDMPF